MQLHLGITMSSKTYTEIKCNEIVYLRISLLELITHYA